MSFFLRLYRITALVLWTLLVPIASLPFQVLGNYGTKRIARLTRFWNRGIARIINLRIKVSGDIHGMQAGLLVSNHLSYLDIITHGSIFTLLYSPKSEIAWWPVIGWATALSRPIWIRRRSKSQAVDISQRFAQTIKSGMHIIVYPEGTTSDGKSGVLPFKSGPFEAVIADNLPILPMVIRYREVPGRATVCWYGDMTLLPHLWEVLGFPSIEAEVRLMPPVRPDGRSRKELAAHVHGMLDSEYKKLLSSP